MKTKLIALTAALALCAPAVAAPARRATPVKRAPAKVAPAPELAPAAVKMLPEFDFLGQRVDQPRNQAAMGKTSCEKKKADNTTQCTSFSFKLGDMPMRYVALYFSADDRLYMVLGSFGEYARIGVLKMLTAKYGEPSEVTHPKWQSKGGVTLDNTVAIWHFRGGDLEYREVGSSLDTGDFIFTAPGNAPPEKAAPVNF